MPTSANPPHRRQHPHRPMGGLASIHINEAVPDLPSGAACTTRAGTRTGRFGKKIHLEPPKKFVVYKPRRRTWQQDWYRQGRAISLLPSTSMGIFQQTNKAQTAPAPPAPQPPPPTDTAVVRARGRTKQWGRLPAKFISANHPSAERSMA